MKRFIVSILFAAVFFMGLGSLYEKTRANFKSDERALTLIRQAREAIGGDANINNVRSLTITAKATKNFEIEGVANAAQGDFELNLQLPNQLSKTLKFTRSDGSRGAEAAEIVEKNVDVIVMKKGDAPEVNVSNDANGSRKVVIMKKGDGDTALTTEDGKKVTVTRDVRVNRFENGMPRQNELFRTTLALLLSAPEGIDVSYTYGGEAAVDGNACEIIVAQTGGAAYKLYLDKSSKLPRMMTYQGVKPLVIKIKKTDGAKIETEKDVKVLTEKMGAPETAEFQVKFTDYRSVNGLLLPFRWTQTVGGVEDETIDVANYEINPANIAEKFNKEGNKVSIRTKKPE